MNSIPMAMMFFVLLGSAWGLSIAFHVRFLAKRQVTNRMKLSSLVQNLAPAITFLYYEMFIIIAIGLLTFSIINGNYKIFLISVFPLLFLLFRLFKDTKKQITYGDQLSILFIFLLSSLAIVPIGMFWVFN